MGPHRRGCHRRVCACPGNARLCVGHGALRQFCGTDLARRFVCTCRALRDCMSSWPRSSLIGLGGYLVGLMGERLTSRENAAPSGGQAGPSTSVGGENLIAFDLDRLFRAERRPDTDLEYPRAEAARILLTTSSHRGMQPEDRSYLVRLTSATTGLAQPDAERRVDDVAARAKENIARARRSAVVLAFTAAAAAVLGAAASWFAACAGGRVRDGETPSHVLLDWGSPIRRT